MTTAQLDGRTAPAPWLHALVANVQDAIVLLDASGRVVFESPSASAILGVPPDDVLGAFGLERIHPDERDAVIRAFERTIAVPGSVARATYRFQRADGRWQHLEALAKNLLADPALRGVLITFRDVTERMHALEAAERAARATEEFLSIAAHELRTPVRAILGWANTLSASDPEGGGEAVEQIQRAGRQLEEVVEDALAFQRSRSVRNPLRIEPVDLRAIIAEVRDTALPAARGPGISVNIASGEPEEIGVLADVGRLGYVLRTLVQNAARFGEGEVDLSCEAEGDRVRIAVRSGGTGASGRAIENVFERFERLGMEGAGGEEVGLGLAIANRLVQMMNGTLGLASAPGEGILFWIELPRS